MAKKAEERDLSEQFIAKMNACRPKKEAKKDGTRNGTIRVVLSDDEVLGEIKYVLRVGIDPFDELTNGFPFGRISEVFGLENCGKTALMMRTMARFCAKHIYEVVSHRAFDYELKRVNPKKVKLIKCYVDNEHSIDKGRKLTMTDITYDAEGKEITERAYWEKVAVEEADTIEQVFQSLDYFLAIIKAEEKAILDDTPEGEEPDTLVFGLFIVDTVAGTSSKDEINREWGERDFPRAAGKISEGFRRLTNEVARHNVAAIFTNQVRTKFQEKTGGGYTVKFSTPQETDFSTYGGKALSFYATHRVFMFQIPVKYVLIQGEQFAAGYLVGFRTCKNRLGAPMRESRMALVFDQEKGGLHNRLSLLESMIFLRVAELHKDGSISFLFRKHGIETTTFAENVKLDEPEGKKGRSKKVEDPEIEGRYQWLAFHRAHRADLDKLWTFALERAKTIRGLDDNYEPTPEELDQAGAEGEDNDPEPRLHRRKPKSVPGISDEDLT